MIYSNIFQTRQTVYLSIEEFPIVIDTFGEDIQSLCGDTLEDELAAVPVNDLTELEEKLLDFLKDGGREYIFVFEH